MLVCVIVLSGGLRIEDCVVVCVNLFCDGDCYFLLGDDVVIMVMVYLLDGDIIVVE